MIDLSAKGYRLLINHISRKAAWVRDGEIEPVAYVEATREHENGSYPNALIRGELVDSDERPSMLVSAGQVELVPLVDITDNPFQGRSSYRMDGIDQLAISIRALGLLQIPVGRRIGNKVQLAFGMTRLRAFRRLSEESDTYEAMPVRICALTDEQMALLAWEENESRSSFTCIEQAQFIRSVMDRFGWAQFEAAQYLGISRSALANKVRLLVLPEPVKKQIAAGDISERQALAMLSGTGAGVQYAEMAAKGLSSDAIRLKAAGTRRRPHKLSDLIHDLCDPESQPHRWVGDEIGLRRALREAQS